MTDITAGADGVPDSPTTTTQETERVRKLLKEIDDARRFDDNARRDYAFCRRYARGDSSFQVSVNLVGTYIDILVAFLYARDPDIDVLPAEAAGGSSGSDVKIYSKTLQIALSDAWRIARVKRKAERWLRSSLTVGVGWLKAGWQEVYSTDPQITARHRDAQDNLARLRRLRAEGQEFSEEELEQLELQAQALEAGLQDGRAERMVYRGMFVDFVPSQDIQVSLDVQNIVDCEGATWIAHRSFVPIEQARDKHTRVPAEDWKSAKLYNAIEPYDFREKGKTAEIDAGIDAAEADSHSTGGGVGADSRGRFACIWEMWRADDNIVYTMAEGVGRFLDDPAVPNVATTRFYPFFPLALHEVEGERHPQSLVMRSYKLQDEYNRAGSGLMELRKNSKPKIGFDARLYNETEIKKVTDGTYGEFVPIKPANDQATVRDGFAEIPRPTIDAALFDRSEIRMELETIWGIQEALTGSIQVAKTATEAEIQQAGTNARTGAMRDRMEEQLTALAHYTAEILVQKYDAADARELAGERSIWIDEVDVNDLDLLVNVKIRAGSTGKPNVAAQREAWAAEAGVIEGTMEKVAALLNTPPDQLAECLWELAVETAERTGDTLDLDRFRPEPGQPMQLVDPMTGQMVLAHPAMQQPGAPGPAGAPAAPVDMPMSGGDPMAPQGVDIAPPELPQQIA